MLDYDFLDKCTDHGLIRAIVLKLKSGEEGHYPHLVKVLYAQHDHQLISMARSACVDRALNCVYFSACLQAPCSTGVRSPHFECGVIISVGKIDGSKRGSIVTDRQRNAMQQLH